MTNPNDIVRKFIKTLDNLNEVINESGGSLFDHTILDNISALDLLITLSCNDIGFESKKKVNQIVIKSGDICPYDLVIGTNFETNNICLEKCPKEYPKIYDDCKILRIKMYKNNGGVFSELCHCPYHGEIGFDFKNIKGCQFCYKEYKEMYKECKRFRKEELHLKNKENN